VTTARRPPRKTSRDRRTATAKAAAKTPTPGAKPAKTAAITIHEALDDPALFAAAFKGDSWRAWRAFLAALFALPMGAEALEIYQRHTGRTTAPTDPFAEAALIVGRRGGKSRVLALIAVFLATMRDYAEYLAPGEVATILVLAADRKQARAIFRYARGLLRSAPLLAALIVDENTEVITLSNRVAIEIGTAGFRNVRGSTLIAALCDEIAFWRVEDSAANPDREILRALRPGLATILGATLLLASSPYAKRGELHAAYRRHYGKDGARVLVWKADTASMNPRLPRHIIEEAYESDPEAARAEYGAEFRDDLADFITREIVEGITATGRTEQPAEAAVTYAAFCDPSGGSADSMTLAIAHLSPDGRGVLDAMLEVRPPFDPDQAVAQCAALLQRYGVSRLIGDKYAGAWPVARFAAHGITFEQSARPKSDLYHDFLALANAGRVELLDIPRLSAQLVGLERRVARSGKDSIDHAPGGHDDVANAGCGVLVGLDLDRRPALVSNSDLTVGGAPVPLPTHADAVYAVAWIDQHGAAAVLYAARCRYHGVPVTLLDFEVGALSRAIWSTAEARLRDLAGQCGAQVGALFVPPALVPHALAAGVTAEPVPAELDPRAVALSVAAHVGAGKVKVAALVDDKAKSAPFRGALDFRAGDATDEPLRAAAVLTVALALIDTSQWRTAA
jgi:hypothetical protein